MRNIHIHCEAQTSTIRSFLQTKFRVASRNDVFWFICSDNYLIFSKTQTKQEKVFKSLFFRSADQRGKVADREQACAVYAL